MQLHSIHITNITSMVHFHKQVRQNSSSTQAQKAQKVYLYNCMQVSQHHYCQTGWVTPALDNNNNTELSSTLILPCCINAPLILCCPIIQITEYFDSFNTFSSKQKLQQTLIPGQTSAWFWLAKGEIYIEQL